MRIVKQITTVLFSAGMLLCMPNSIQAQGNDQVAAIQQKLDQQFIKVKVAGDGSIVTAGSVLVLHKDGLKMCSIAVPDSLDNTYKNGKLSAGMFSWGLMLGLNRPPIDSNQVPQRTFMSGEKFWVVADSVSKNGVVFKFWSDPDNNGVRYYTQLNFPFQKKIIPPVDDVMKTIAEVFTVDAPPEAAPAAQSAPPPAPAAPEPPPPPEPAMAPIAPPPPPPAAPKTIALGQTKDEVAAILGQPDKVANLGTKEIDYYPDMKITFVKGKVTDIQ